MDERSYEVGQDKKRKNKEQRKVGEITQEILGKEVELKWYGYVRREEHCLGRRAMEMKLQERRTQEKNRWLDKVKGDIKEKGLSADEANDGAMRRRLTSYTTKVGMR